MHHFLFKIKECEGVEFSSQDKITSCEKPGKQFIKKLLLTLPVYISFPESSNS